MLAKMNGLLFLFSTVLVASFLSQSPKFFVNGRTIKTRDVATTTLDDLVELISTESTTLAPTTTTETLKISTNMKTTPESITEATTVNNERDNPTLLEYESNESSSSPNRSLYEELKATSFYPSTFSSFETSSEFIKFENLKMMDSEENEDNKSDESLEKKFAQDEQGFKNNATKEERHTLEEAKFDGQTIMYSSVNLKINNDTKDQNEDENLETTIIPIVLTTAKKGKNLDLVQQQNGENMNASIPDAAEVWALAGMREVETRNPLIDSDETSGEMMVGGLNNTAKNLLDWSEIAKMDNDSMIPNENIEDLNVTTTSIPSDKESDDNDASTSEMKRIEVFLSSLHPMETSSSIKPLIEDNRLELDNDNIDFDATRKASSRKDTEEFGKSQEEKDESAFELIDSFKTTDNKQKKQSIRLEETEMTNSEGANTEMFSTESAESFATTTTENYETTTSIVDSFTEIGEENDSEDVFKRTVTESTLIPTTEQTTTPLYVQTTTVINNTIQMELVQVTTSSEPQTTTILPTKESPETQREIKSTKSLRMETTEEPSTTRLETTIVDNESLASTFIPRYQTSQNPTTLQQHVSESSTVSQVIEFGDNEKFKYSTILPEEPSVSETPSKVGTDSYQPTIKTNVDSLNKELLDGEQAGSGNLTIISVTVSVVVLLIIAAVAYFVLRRRNQQKFSQRCRPVGLDAYSLDNVSVYNSVRRKANALRLSKRSYGNSAFENPSIQSNVLDYQSLQDFAKKKSSIQDEFKEIPQVSVRVDEMPANCEDKNRYANVVPLPETRVHLQRLNDEEKSEYINANFVKGPKDSTNYYIATQAPLENTVTDFWRMIWEQNSKVIIQATDLTENGVERCVEYLPASVVLDNSLSVGDMFQVTMKSRELKGKYAVSQLHLKNLKTNTWREIMHLWYTWPENGSPSDESSVLSLLLDARSYLRTNLPEQLDENSNADYKNSLSTLDKTKSLQRVQGPLVIHCSPGTGRTGTLIACDIIIRMLETPPRQIDIPQIVYNVRRGRANSVRTKDQYELIYDIANAYATKLTTAPAET